jgi:hypothetical protein
MAKPIKETPFLSGKDAEKFVTKIQQNNQQKASKAEYDKVMQNYRKIEFKNK